MGAAIARVIPHACGRCRHFERFDSALKGRIAGVSSAADGRCRVRKLGSQSVDYRAETDWCDKWERKA